MVTDRIVRGVLVAGAALFLLIGAWALIDPASFYAHVATFPPYNRHFLHDVGAFNLGIGAALALGLTGWPGTGWRCGRRPSRPCSTPGPISRTGSWAATPATRSSSR